MDNYYFEIDVNVHPDGKVTRDVAVLPRVPGKHKDAVADELERLARNIRVNGKDR